MTITRKEIRKFLNKKIAHLNDIIADIDILLSKLETEFYRVAIFGSARIGPDSPIYKDAYELAYQLAMRGVDIVTGGGPGLMDAANKGAKEGGQHSRSIGLPIALPFEVGTNAHLDVKREHRRFSSRLDEFMRISHAVVVTPGGIGTLLEFIYTWQLMQVKHIPARPILLLGGDKMWPDFLHWMKKWSLAQKLMNKEDFTNISFCKSIQDVIMKLEPDIKRFQSQAKKTEETIT
ncbi:MAG: LOG family protein [Deltaproteobacteria bacterium]|nr:LOG family protein [Deltaproteobacteria bacterium]